jgi:hypothetical protein
MSGRRNSKLGRDQISILCGFVLIVVTFLGGCQGAPSAAEVSAREMEQAKNALQPLKEQLVDALTGALQEGGPESAIAVCREKAPQIAAELSVNGVRMGRTSHKLRNPDNAPQDWVEPLLAAYLEDPQNSEPRAVRLDDSRIGYVEPIYAMSFCLSCHGPSIDPALQETIRSLYPEDQATGFHMDDVRGLFWVTLPIAGGAEADT